MRTNLRAALVAARQPGKTPSGLTLPNMSGPPISGVPSMHIFGIALG
jgi:hypothetical protein